MLLTMSLEQIQLQDALSCADNILFDGVRDPGCTLKIGPDPERFVPWYRYWTPVVKTSAAALS
jgi:hypothetical protein